MGKFLRRLKSFKLRRILRDGEDYPKGYGLAYMDYMRRAGIAYPLGLNWIVWAWHHFVLWFESPPIHGGDIVKRSYLDGYEDARDNRPPRY